MFGSFLSSSSLFGSLLLFLCLLFFLCSFKEVRALNSSLGLKEAKDLVDATPATLLEKANKETADKAKAALEAAGAKVSVK